LSRARLLIPILAFFIAFGDKDRKRGRRALAEVSMSHAIMVE